MAKTSQVTRRRTFVAATLAAGLAMLSVGTILVTAAEPAKQSAKQKQIALGSELFSREWIPNDSRSHSGDGLGPMYNESSCVACHNLGGPGGAGPVSKNVDIITAFSNRQRMGRRAQSPTLPEAIVRALFGGLTEPKVKKPVEKKSRKQLLAERKKALAEQKERDRKELVKIHPGFQTTRSVVLHRFATEEGYQRWRSRLAQGGFMHINSVAFVSPALADGLVVEAPLQALEPVAIATTQARRFDFERMEQLRMQVQMGRHQMSGVTSQVGNFALLRSQRSPTPLFGLGLLDAIDDKTLVEASLKKHKKFPEVSGRVARLKDGRIGRFGWKAQIVSLEDFTLTACAVELGLDVPKHPQAGSTQNPKYKSPGHDLTKAQADAMVAFLAALPAPKQRQLAPGKDKEYIDGGEALFAKVGCATCHTKNLGEAKGVYSDLLVHDMGPELGDSGGSYGVFIPNSSPDDEPVEIQPLARGFAPPRATTKAKSKKKIIGATRQEWRTPPLWGLRDSSPYLHDGRADTVEQAIAMHGGEARRIARGYFRLKPAERQQVVLFLKSQVAPKQTAVAGSR
ncbi:MAG: hypothetical protein IIA67_06335 [Planctomycetes bacterium]|nr:hypothetical protein [Planctomycetota bacterium]